MYGFYTTGDPDYAQWVLKNDKRSNEECLALARASSQFSYRPLFSVVVPVYSPDPLYLRRAVMSVICQAYDLWELILVDDCSPGNETRALLSDLARLDTRIRCIFRSENGHISLATNSGLEACRGDFVALLDHDDELSEHALFCAARKLNETNQLDILFSDEDKIDAFGNRTGPTFKANLTPEVLYSMNAVSHLGIYRRSLLTEIGGFRAGIEGSQDYDLILRSMEKTTYARVAHLPFILYHWRTLMTSTAGTSDAKPYAYIAAQRALSEHFERLGRPRKVAMPYTGFYRWWEESRSSQHRIHCFVHLPGTPEAAEDAMADLRGKTSGDNVSWTCVPLQGVDEATRALELFDAIFGSANASKTGFLACVDARLSPEDPYWLRELAMQAGEPDIGLAGGMLAESGADTYLQAGVNIGPKGRPLSRFRGMPRYRGLHCGRPLILDNVSMHTFSLFVVRWSHVPDDLESSPLWDLALSLRLLDANKRSVYSPWACLRGPRAAVCEVSERVAEGSGRRAWRLLLKAPSGRRRVDPFVSPHLNLGAPHVSFVNGLNS